MAKIFISYARADGKDIAEEFQYRLLLHKHDVFLDIHGIPGGSEWEKELIKRGEWCDTLLLLITPAGNESKYVYQEFREAEKNKKRIIPIIVNDSKLPVHLTKLNALPLQFTDRSDNSIDTIILRLDDIWEDEKVPATVGRALLLSSIGIVVIALVLAVIFLLSNQDKDPVVTELDNSATEEIANSEGTAVPVDGAANSLPIAVPTVLGGSEKFAFYSNRTGADNIYTMLTNGSERVNLTKPPDTGWGPDWSPDGSQIAFTLNTNGDDEIYIMDADGQNPINVSNRPDSKEMLPTWSPQGDQILFQSNMDGDYEIYLLTIGQETLTPITDNDIDDTSAAWSPDGSKIAFTRGQEEAKDIWIMTLSNKEAYQLTRRIGADDDAAWSTDGKFITFTSTRDGNRDIYMMEADGTNPINLTNNPAEDFSPAWSPDGTLIAFTTNRDGNWDIYTLNVTSGELTNITRNEWEDWFPAWQPQ